MRDIFLADAHLRHPADANYQHLLTFLEQQRGHLRTLYLLGDIFEFWVGYRHVVFAPYVPLLESLRRLRQAGTDIVYVEGNHDFHLGPYFAEELGCRVLTTGEGVDLDGRPVFIAHGDLVNPRDRAYRLLRRTLRSLPLRLLLQLLPPDWTWGIAHCASRQSGKGHLAKRRRWVPEQMLAEHANRRFAEGYQAVVTGHFHAPWLQRNPEGTVVSLGDWLDQYSYAVWEDGEFRLETFAPWPSLS
ncbi:MAG: UDP-2,3-diacylglucosamine diphosphatase [Desulfuromonadales bacterium]|nr:UDP-2,3-diacylglucosamine diphosphatase [Desulfuromonadales bacterium]